MPLIDKTINGQRTLCELSGHKIPEDGSLIPITVNSKELQRKLPVVTKQGCNRGVSL